jgi:hypothetical protein
MRYIENFIREFPRAFIAGVVGLFLTMVAVIYSVIKKVI